MKAALIIALAGSATAFAPRSVSRPSVAVKGSASSVRHTILSSFTAPEPPRRAAPVPPGPVQRGGTAAELLKKHLWLAVARGRRPRRAQLHKILPE